MFVGTTSCTLRGLIRLFGGVPGGDKDQSSPREGKGLALVKAKFSALSWDVQLGDVLLLCWELWAQYWESSVEKVTHSAQSMQKSRWYPHKECLNPVVDVFSHPLSLFLHRPRILEMDKEENRRSVLLPKHRRRSNFSSENYWRRSSEYTEDCDEEEEDGSPARKVKMRRHWGMHFPGLWSWWDWPLVCENFLLPLAIFHLASVLVFPFRLKSKQEGSSGLFLWMEECWDICKDGTCPVHTVSWVMGQMGISTIGSR